MRLSQKDFGALQQAILQLYEYRDFEIFRQAVPAIFLKLIPAEAFWWPEYHVDVAAKQVASWVAKGKTNPEIGIILQGSIRTVEKHMERILEKLGVENRASAAVMVAQAAPTGAERKSYIAAQEFGDVQDAPHPPSGHPLPSGMCLAPRRCL